MQLFATNKNAFESPYTGYGIEYMDPRDEEFFAGAKQAFTTTTNAIFNHQHLHDMNELYDRKQAQRRADERSAAMKKYGTYTKEGGKTKQMSPEEITMLKALHGYHANLINPFNDHTDYTYRFVHFYPKTTFLFSRFFYFLYHHYGSEEYTNRTCFFVFYTTSMNILLPSLSSSPLSDNNIHDPAAVEQARLKALHRADLREGLEKDSMSYSPALDDIFDSKLTKYFQQAIEEHHKCNQRVYYKLHHIGRWSGASSQSN